MKKLYLVGRALPTLLREAQPSIPDWQHCDPNFIRQALARALDRPSGGWYVVDATRAIQDRPAYYQIDGKEVVACRLDGRLIVARHACPHMAGPLSRGRILDHHLVCPWHGLPLQPGHQGWQVYETHDDGVLTWVRFIQDDASTATPLIAPRPASYISAVIRREAACEPRDIIANRLDPWHGAHYHPHTFARLVVTKIDLDRLEVRVAYRVWGPLCIEVNAAFHSPEPRSIVMTIIAGEGAGSVVETHATPIVPGRSAVIEATLATSDRPGFGHALKAAALIRPLIMQAAHRLWVEDAAYAERAYLIRHGKIG